MFGKFVKLENFLVNIEYVLLSILNMLYYVFSRFEIGNLYF